MWLSWNNLLHTVATWHGTEFYWNRNTPLSWIRSLMEGFTLSSSISFLCFLAFIVLINHTNYIFIFWSDSIRNHKTRWFTEVLVQSECKYFSIPLFVYFMLSLSNIKFFVSSQKITSSYYFSRCLTCILDQFNHFKRHLIDNFFFV